MKARDGKLILILGILISIISLLTAFFGWKPWYFVGTFGFWFFFDYFSSKKNKITAIQLFINNKKSFTNLYMAMLALGMSIEYLGKFVFGFWHYPYQSLLFEIILILLYPFILFATREIYETSKLIIKNKVLSVVLAMIIGIVLMEIPNLYSGLWIYTVPFGFDILGINVIVLIGWVILILAPAYVYDKFFNNKILNIK
ncbi:MAG: hypothetical protein AABW63_03320 [Nanoarchaeota archaeon]